MRTLLLSVLICGCKEDAQSAPVEWKPPPKPSFETTPGPEANWWCFTSPNTVETCDRMRGACDLRRKDWLDNWGLRDKAPEPCRPLEKAVCVVRTKTLDGTMETACYPSFTICRNMRDNMMRGDRGDWKVTADCEAM